MNIMTSHPWTRDFIHALFGGVTDWNQATVQDGRVVVQNVQGRQNRGQGNNVQGGGVAGYRGAQNRVRNANPDVDDASSKRTVVVSALDEEQIIFYYMWTDIAIDEDVGCATCSRFSINVG
ncbi:hypothetical protein Tco_0873007 [Tanacetum coccineum]